MLQYTNESSNSNTPPYKPTTTVLKSFHVLEFISNNQPVKPSVIADRLGLTRTNVHRILTTLMEVGYIAKEDHRGYRLTFKLFKLGSRVPLSQDLREIAKPLMAELAVRANENVYLTVLYGDMVNAIEEVKSSNPLSLNPDVTYNYPIHACASGKNFLAYMTDEEREEILSRANLTPRTSRTLTKLDEIDAELARVRERGYATEITEFSDDLNSYAAPIFDYSGRMVAGLSISGPSIRATTERLDALVQPLLEATRFISQQLGRRE
ncbi:MAG: IclR family transcriptional regulator [Alkalispirochaeta sp.]